MVSSPIRWLSGGRDARVGYGVHVDHDSVCHLGASSSRASRDAAGHSIRAVLNASCYCNDADPDANRANSRCYGGSHGSSNACYGVCISGPSSGRGADYSRRGSADSHGHSYCTECQRRWSLYRHQHHPRWL